jgi:hypothetical protein
MSLERKSTYFGGKNINKLPTFTKEDWPKSLSIYSFIADKNKEFMSKIFSFSIGPDFILNIKQASLFFWNEEKRTAYTL